MKKQGGKGDNKNENGVIPNVSWKIYIILPVVVVVAIVIQRTFFSKTKIQKFIDKKFKIFHTISKAHIISRFIKTKEGIDYYNNLNISINSRVEAILKLFDEHNNDVDIIKELLKEFGSESELFDSFEKEFDSIDKEFDSFEKECKSTVKAIK